MKRFVSIFAVTAACAVASAIPALSQNYPNQQIRFVTGFPPGSGADLFTRFMAERMKEVSSASIVVENRAGATGSIALENVARAKPDGYTVLVTAGSATAAANHIYKERRVNVLDAFRIAATITQFGFLIAVDPKSPHKTLQDLTAHLKQKGDKANYGVSATSGIALAEMYNAFAELRTTRITYRGSPEALNELYGGNLDFLSIDPGFALPQANQGKLRILAVSTAKRIASMPDVPTMEEGGVKGINIPVWWALILPKQTPDAVINMLNGWANAALEKPESKKFFQDAGGEVFISKPADADAMFIRDEKSWEEYLRIAKIEKQ